MLLALQSLKIAEIVPNLYGLLSHRSIFSVANKLTDIIIISKLISNGGWIMLKSKTTEFKREFTDDIKYAVIPFANTCGDKIYIGLKMAVLMV